MMRRELTVSAAVTFQQNLAVPIREPTPEPEIIPEVKLEPQEPSTSVKQEEEEPDMHGNVDIQIHNVVCDFTLPIHIDLRALANRSYNVAYDRGKGVLRMQKRSPECHVKIFSSGKIFITGCKSEVDCKKAARQAARHIQICLDRTNQTIRIRNFRVSNLLATCRMPFGVKIEELHRKYPAETNYEPELMVGLEWRHAEPKATLRIHTTGSITIAGASSEANVQTILEHIYPIVYEFRCQARSKEDKAKARKRKATEGPLRRNPKRKAATSGVYGNSVYFSDEEDDLEFEDYSDADFLDEEIEFEDASAMLDLEEVERMPAGKSIVRAPLPLHSRPEMKVEQPDSGSDDDDMIDV